MKQKLGIHGKPELSKDRGQDQGKWNRVGNQNNICILMRLVRRSLILMAPGSGGLQLSLLLPFAFEMASSDPMASTTDTNDV